jgi:hypothetical protein
LRYVNEIVGEALMQRRVFTAAVSLLLCLFCLRGWAADSSARQMKSLDEQVQETKADVLSIGAELNRLEEKLLYPSGTQLAIFVSAAKGQDVRLDAIHIKVDGRVVADYIYSFKELQALRKGGVQRIYTGNVATGQHRLDVSVVGKLQSGKDFTEDKSFTFTKRVKPKLLDLTLAQPGSAKPAIRLGD